MGIANMHLMTDEEKVKALAKEGYVAPEDKQEEKVKKIKEGDKK